MAHPPRAWSRTLPQLSRARRSQLILGPFTRRLDRRPLFVIGKTSSDGNGGSAIALNVFKCSTAYLLFLVAKHRASTPAAARTLPTASAAWRPRRVALLGIVIGDSLWLWALGALGAEQTILLTALQPFLAAIVGWAMLGQTPREVYGGMAVAAIGIYLAQLKDVAEFRRRFFCGVPTSPNGEADGAPMQAADEAGSSAPAAPPKFVARHKLKIGMFVQLVNVLLDQIGAAITRVHGVGLSAWTISLYRFGFASVVGLLLYGALLCRRPRCNLAALPPQFAVPWSRMDARKWLHVLLGVFMVTFLCPAMNAYSLFGMDLGVWALLGALGPAWSPPVKYLFKKGGDEPLRLGGRDHRRRRRRDHRVGVAQRLTTKILAEPRDTRR